MAQTIGRDGLSSPPKNQRGLQAVLGWRAITFRRAVFIFIPNRAKIVIEANKAPAGKTFAFPPGPQESLQSL